MPRPTLAILVCTLASAMPGVARCQVARTWSTPTTQGDFSNAFNWSPLGVPGPSDTAIFNPTASGVREVAFPSDASSNVLRVNAGAQVQRFLTRVAPFRTYSVGSAELNASRVELRSLTLRSTNHLSLDGGATLAIGAAGVVSSFDGRLGSVVGSSGTVSVDGAGAVWESRNNLHVGDEGLGTGTVAGTNGSAIFVGDRANSSVYPRALVVAHGSAGGAGGNLNVFNGSTLNYSGNAIVGTEANGGRYGSVLVSGPGWALNVSGEVAVELYGRLTLENGGSATAGSSLVLNASQAVLTESAGTLRSNRISLSSGGALAFDGGRLVVGTYAGDLAQNGGVLEPSAAIASTPGSTVIQGNYLLAVGTLESRLLGNGSADRLNVNGIASLGGTLALSVGGSYAPAIGDAAVVVNAGVSINGTFGSVAGVRIDDDRYVAVLYGPRSVTARIARPGDANVDGAVNFVDLLALAQNYNDGDGTWSRGDFDGTGIVDFNDLLLLARAYNAAAAIAGDDLDATLVADWQLARSIVPEPVAIVMPVLVGLAVRRRRIPAER